MSVSSEKGLASQARLDALRRFVAWQEGRQRSGLEPESAFDSKGLRVDQPEFAGMAERLDDPLPPESSRRVGIRCICMADLLASIQEEGSDAD